MLFHVLKLSEQLTRRASDGTRYRSGEEQRDQRVHPVAIRPQYACFVFTARTKNAPLLPPSSTGAPLRADRYPAHIQINCFDTEGSISTPMNLTLAKMYLLDLDLRHFK